MQRFGDVLHEQPAECHDGLPRGHFHADAAGLRFWAAGHALGYKGLKNFFSMGEKQLSMFVGWWLGWVGLR